MRSFLNNSDIKISTSLNSAGKQFGNRMPDLPSLSNIDLPPNQLFRIQGQYFSVRVRGGT